MARALSFGAAFGCVYDLETPLPTKQHPRANNMSIQEPIVLDDSDYEVVQDSGDEALFSEDEDDNRLPEVIPIIDDDAELSSTRLPIRDINIRLPDVKEHSVKLFDGTTIRPGDTVELRDAAMTGKKRQSGDYLRVHYIIHNLETDGIRLRGHRLRRCKYHGPIFDWKLNEVVMLLHTTEGDARSHWIQGLEDHPLEEVLQQKHCTITHKSYFASNFSTETYPSFFNRLSDEEKKDWVFHKGKLFCRAVHIIHLSANGKSYNGIVRHISEGEADDQPRPSPAAGTGPGSSEHTGIFIDAPDDAKLTPKHRVPFPVVAQKYTFGDAFCGAGGTSQGAKQAGLVVKWGLEIDHRALQAYTLNHGHAEPFLMDVRDFPPPLTSKEAIRVDILHLSPPCQYWSMVHTVPGANDQDNYEALYTVQRVLRQVNAKVVTLEMAPGLLLKHGREFRQLLNQFWSENYNVRYGVRDFSGLGLVQRRRRLLIIAAKRGYPLPPFPAATHGPQGSGLERFTSVYDALHPLRTLGPQSLDDQYHLPQGKLTKPTYDPTNTHLKGCITTNGGDNYHWDGQRRFTPRENSLFQGFPYGYYFFGSARSANRQIGNAVPPIVAEAMFRTIAAALEAFSHGFIGADDEIEDLYNHLAQNPKAVLPEPAERRLGERFDRPASNSGFRYLVRQKRNTSGSSSPSGSSTPTRRAALFSHSIPIELGPRRDFNEMYRSRKPARKEERHEGWQLLEASGEVIDLSGDDD
ncbi:S-adenosyl-L-methionine-dependent methyltransferase [Amniculicola lignicola CBS 123094]|uniref:DNA (cytosine-5-)-methyltransferase n=1 Tax=Amniculicola lignicola CBS 123094 TaxID=1392246 RepID=A0A6A5WYK8_9PLEO|nr:S-adenosyl-L-methionine-dependent methyltransferase [Amniculicola lignicola CBS 123094]